MLSNIPAWCIAQHLSLDMCIVLDILWTTVPSLRSKCYNINPIHPARNSLKKQKSVYIVITPSI